MPTLRRVRPPGHAPARVKRTESGRDYRLGWRLTSARRGDPGFEIGLAATRREGANADAEHGVARRGVIRW